MLVFQVAAWVTIAIAGLIALYWAIVLVRLATLLPQIPRVRSGLAMAEPSGGWPRVSIIVPAHNEERVIESCARTLLASDYPALEVVIVLDRCTDRTRELLRPFEADSRLVLVENATCPPDWAGKCNAARVGAERTMGEYILFTDADAAFDPELVRAAVGMAIRDRLDLLSLLPTLTMNAWFEWVVQPVATMTLLRMYPIDKVNRDSRRRPFANGQFMLFTRAMYERIGGHTAVKDDLLEDIAFARCIESAGGRGAIAVADHMLVVSMYPSLRAMRTGWKRIFMEACKRKMSRLRRHAVRVVSLGALAPLVQVAALFAGWSLGGLWIIAAGAVVLGGALLQTFALAVTYAACHAPLRSVLFFPIGSLIVAKALWDGAADLRARRPVRWGGREYILIPRDS
ncbi:MAG: glycosyltransferase family 2 protein [Phycisphaerae bacterium]|nr:glycosyltransferase family 2 protein [Phycisphaerae bacterium]